MRHILIAAGVAGVLIASASLWAAWTTAARPALRLEPPVVDFGPLAQRATRIIEVRNDGRAPLRVLGISTSCGCTTAVISMSVLPAHGSARLEITFDPAAHGPVPGPARHAVYVRTDDPKTPEAEVEVRAVVVKGDTR
jgi:hypothetical protein